MPNRIIKESICTSDTVDGLSWFEEVLFYRLIVNCDDYGRFDGRAAVIKNRLFPLKDNMTLKNVESAINKLERVGLISTYYVEGKPYLHLPTWNEHQTIRAKRSKYPTHDEGTKSREIICMQMQADESICHRNPIQSVSESISESECEDSAEPLAATAPPVASVPLNTGEEYLIYQDRVDEWQVLYPAVDVMQELRNMRGWCLANTSKRKTSSGVLRFITNWLSREQDRGGRKTIAQASGARPSFQELAKKIQEGTL